MSALHVSEWYKLCRQCPGLSVYKDAVSGGGISTGVSISAELPFLRIIGEVVMRVDSLMEESDAVQVVIRCWGSEISRPVPQKDAALVVVREFLWREAYRGVFKTVNIGTLVVKAFLHLKRSFQP